MKQETFKAYSLHISFYKFKTFGLSLEQGKIRVFFRFGLNRRKGN
jgi:hypothetical protein